MIADGLAQNSISYTFAFGALGARLKLDLTKVVTLGVLTRWALLASMAVWYSVIDPPGINDEPHPGEQWAFLFPSAPTPCRSPTPRKCSCSSRRSFQ
jgi:hypothetical protein